MIELGLVRLYLAKVTIVEIATVPQISVAEDNHATTTIANRQILARFVEIQSGENVGNSDTGWVSLTQSIHIHPAGCAIGRSGRLRHCIRLSTRLKSRLSHGHRLNPTASKCCRSLMLLLLKQLLVGRRNVLLDLLGARSYSARTARACRSRLNWHRLLNLSYNRLLVRLLVDLHNKCVCSCSFFAVN